MSRENQILLIEKFLISNELSMIVNKVNDEYELFI